MPSSTEASPAAGVVPCRRDMKRRLQEELDAVRGLLSKAEALVALAREDVNGGAAAPAPAKRSPRRIRSPPRRGRSDRKELDRARDRRGGRSRREELDRERDRRRSRRSHREELDRERDRRRNRWSDREELDRERDRRRRRSDREEFDRARKSRRLHEAEPEPRKIEAAGAPPQCHPKDGEIAPAVDAPPSLCQLEDGEIAPAMDASPSLCQHEEDDHGAAMDIDIRGGVSPLVVDKTQSSPLSKKDDDELVDVSGEASPVAIKSFPEVTKSSISPSSNSSESSCSDAPSLGNYSGDDDDDGGESSRPDTTCLPMEAAATTPLAADNALTERAAAAAAAASPATQTSQLNAIAKEKQRLRRELERRRAREALEALARAARPIRDDIDAMDMMQLGLFEAQYIVSPVKSQDSLRRGGGGGGGGGGLLQQLGFFLKPEYS